jgi:hypothetical protein
MKVPPAIPEHLDNPTLAVVDTILCAHLEMVGQRQ